MKKNNVLKVTLVAVAVIAFFSFLFAFGSFGVDAVLACIPLEEGGQAPPADCTCGSGENAGTPSCDAFGEAYCNFGSVQGECGDEPPEGTVGGKSGGVTSSLQGDTGSTGTTDFGSLSVNSFTALLNGEKFTCNKEVDAQEACVKTEDCNYGATCGFSKGSSKGECLVCVDSNGNILLRNLDKQGECDGTLVPDTRTIIPPVTSGESFVEDTNSVLPGDDIGFKQACGKDGDCGGNGRCGKANGESVCIVCVESDEDGNRRTVDFSTRQCEGRLYIQG